MVGDKFRFRFAKTGDLRFLSHHDLARCVERMMRRARAPFRMTSGFHPQPRIVFALSLPLGVIGRNEVLEVELSEPRDADELLAMLQEQAPAGWTFTSIRSIPMKLSATVRRMVYELPLPDRRVAEVRERADALLDAAEVWIDRYKPHPRQVDVRRFLRAITTDNSRLRLDLWVTPTGTARADELLTRLGVTDLLDAGAVLERTELELVDETPPDASDSPPTGPALTRPLELPSGYVPAEDEPSPTATWGLSPNGPVVE